MSRSTARTLFRALFAVLLGVAFAAWGQAADAGCACPMAHEAGTTCCCEPALSPAAPGGPACSSTCAGAPQWLAAAPVPVPVVFAALAAAPATWPDPPAFVEVGLPMHEQARPPPRRPTWLRNRTLLL